MGMTVMVMDREKIISLLEEMSDYFMECRTNASLGSKAENHFWELQIAAQDAATMLEEQEAKTGTWQWKIHGRAESGGTLGEAICDQCGKSTYATAVKSDLNYCPNCGAKMTDRR